MRFALPPLKRYPSRYPCKFYVEASLAKYLFLLAVPRGVEPPTFGLGNRCSINTIIGI